MNDDLRSEYRFDYWKEKPNRFAAKLKKGARLVVLEPEIAEMFHDSKDVNAALKALIKDPSRSWFLPGPRYLASSPRSMRVRTALVN